VLDELAYTVVSAEAREVAEHGVAALGQLDLRPRAVTLPSPWATMGFDGVLWPSLGRTATTMIGAPPLSSFQ